MPSRNISFFSPWNLNQLIAALIWQHKWALEIQQLDISDSSIYPISRQLTILKKIREYAILCLY